MSIVEKIDKEKFVLIIEPNDMQRMLLEIWLSRTPFKVVTAIKDTTYLTEVLHNFSFDVAIIQGSMSTSVVLKCVYILFQNNVSCLCLAPSIPSEFKQVLNSNSSVTFIKEPFNQKQLIEKLSDILK